MAQITYTDKVALNENPEIAAINKVSDDDMNEIKSVVNANYNNTIQITNSQPTDSDNKIWIDTGEVGSAVSEITNEYSTSTGKGYSANYVNNMKKIVWTNSSPSSAITETTITIDDMTDYDSYEILYYYFDESYSGNIMYSTGIIKKGKNCILNGFQVDTNQAVIYSRQVEYISNTSLKLYNASSETIGTNGTIVIGTSNHSCVPMYIVGHKTGLWN